MKIQFLALIFLTFLAYINIFNNEFLSDDIEGILKSPTISDFGYNLKSLSVPNTIRSINYQIAAFSPWIYHLTNLLFHIANTLLFYSLLIFLGLKYLAFPASLIFALHPIHAETIAWKSGLSYPLYTFFSLLVIISFLKFSQNKSLKNLFFSLFFFPFALLSSEKAMILPLILFGLIISLKNIHKKIAFLILPVFFLMVLPISFRTVGNIPQKIDTAHSAYSKAPKILNPTVQIPVALVTYTQLLVFPYNLTLYHSPIINSITQLNLMRLYSIFLILLLPVLFIKNRLLFFFLFLALVSLIPTLLPISIAWVVAERYIYFGSTAFAVFLAFLIFKIFKKTLAYIILTPILAVYLLLTLNRNGQWKNQDVLWPATLKYSDNVSLSHNNMGDYYSRRNDLFNAKKEFLTAIEMENGDYPAAVHNLANTYLLSNEASHAASLYKRALALDPNIYESYLQLAQAEIILKNYEEAKAVIKKALEKFPNTPDLKKLLESTEAYTRR